MVILCLIQDWILEQILIDFADNTNLEYARLENGLIE